MSFVGFVLSFLRIRSAYAEVGDTADRMEWEWPANNPHFTFEEWGPPE